MKNLKKFFTIVLIFLLASCAHASDSIIDNSVLKVRDVKEMDMSKILPSYKGNGSFKISEAPEFNLSRMKNMNPDFTTYPEEQGIIWLKHVSVAREISSLDFTRLYVILGRAGLADKWLNWNIPIPSGGMVDIIEASMFDYDSLKKINDFEPVEDTSAEIKTVKFQRPSKDFIIVMAWREHLPAELSVEGLSWFQEELRVWESVLDVTSTAELSYRTFPSVYSPEHENFDGENIYRWRRINIDPHVQAGELARIQRQGVVFGSRKGGKVLSALQKTIENVGAVTPPHEVKSRRVKVIDWLSQQEEIELTEGAPRKIPSNLKALTRREKLLLAKAWLTSQQAKAALSWRLPFEPDENTPLCPGLFFDPVLEVTTGKKSEYYNFELYPLAGLRIFGINTENGRFTTRRLPSSSARDNRLTAVMNFNLDENGILSGTVDVLLRGAWGDFILGLNPDNNKIQEAALFMFPGLRNFEVQQKKNKDFPELLIKISSKPGVAGTGKGILAVLPFFEPQNMRKIGAYEPPVDLLFPFIIEQNITINFPKSASESLLTGTVNRTPDPINYSHSYTNRRHRLIAEAKLEVGLQNINTSSIYTLQNCLDQWRNFCLKPIPIR